MKFAIIVSKKDIAGLNIKDKLQKYHSFLPTEEIFDSNSVMKFGDKNNEVKLFTIENDSIHSENIDKKIYADNFIFATKHQAASGTHSLSIHVPGNFGMAGAGGKNHFLGKAMSSFMKYSYKRMQELSEGLNFQIIQECTHHGPCIDKPVMFIEIGSSQESWIREDAGKIIAQIIYELVVNEIPILKEYAVIGGMHYNYVADKINKNTEFCVGHICTKYNMDNLNEEIVEQIVLKSETSSVEFLFDWKGANTAESRNKVISIIESKGYKWHRSDKFFKE
ncbi:MAG: D-aminoacyl-tRNA deacylase [Candidatus Woesearchaeota archaeon]|jgi:D-aminoacyl-tRNA deacylase